MGPQTTCWRLTKKPATNAPTNQVFKQSRTLHMLKRGDCLHIPAQNDVPFPKPREVSGLFQLAHLDWPLPVHCEHVSPVDAHAPLTCHLSLPCEAHLLCRFLFDWTFSSHRLCSVPRKAIANKQHHYDKGCHQERCRAHKDKVVTINWRLRHKRRGALLRARRAQSQHMFGEASHA